MVVTKSAIRTCGHNGCGNNSLDAEYYRHVAEISRKVNWVGFLPATPDFGLGERIGQYGGQFLDRKAFARIMTDENQSDILCFGFQTRMKAGLAKNQTVDLVFDRFAEKFAR